MLKIRSAKIIDLGRIQEIEKMYYEGFCCSDEILEKWINSSPDNFFVTEDENKIVGFIFFEYINELQTLAFIHDTIRAKGRFAYISDIGICDTKNGVGQKLFEVVLKKARANNCEMIIWVTGEKRKHDKIEREILFQNGFSEKEKISHWEAYPGHFVDDHSIWIKKLK